MDIQKLYDDHVLLVHHLARLNIGRLKAVDIQIDHEELAAIFSEVLIIAGNQWDEEKSRFSTYLTAACNNKVTAMLRRHFTATGEANRVMYEFEMTANGSSDDADDSFGIDYFGGDDNAIAALEVRQALEAELKKVSPFARLLVEYTLCPPDFIEREILAQEAKHEYSLERDAESTHRRRPLSLTFVANCLMQTTNDGATKNFIRKAVNEAKSAVLRAAT